MFDEEKKPEEEVVEETPSEDSTEPTSPKLPEDDGKPKDETVLSDV